MIRSTQTTLKFSNTGKMEKIHLFIDEYRRVVSCFVDILWEIDSVQPLLGKELTSQVDTWLSARAIQCAGKQASGIVRGCRKKQSKRLFQINKFKVEGAFKKARKLQAVYDGTRLSKPNIDTINPELDSRFISVDLANETDFDGWLTLGSLGLESKMSIPFKRTKHFNELFDRGVIKKGVRLAKNKITFMFDLPEPNPVRSGDTVGIDIGQTTTLTCSNGQRIEIDKHGHTYGSICAKLSRKKKGSKNFTKTVRHRSNYINWATNQIDLTNTQVIKLENIKHLRRYKTSSRKLSHWNYAELFDRLEEKLYESGVQIIKVSPTYTSQRCSNCGWTRKRNRKGKQFKCDKCSFECDADLNGSLNISFDLPPIRKEERLQQKNRNGFYWPVVSKEPIVPSVQKTDHSFL